MRTGAAEAAGNRVAAEAPLELRIGGRAMTVIMRTPGCDEELARGFLYTEGLIATAADVSAIERPPGLVGDELGNVLSITLAAGCEGPRTERLFYASSSCGVAARRQSPP